MEPSQYNYNPESQNDLISDGSYPTRKTNSDVNEMTLMYYVEISCNEDENNDYRLSHPETVSIEKRTTMLDEAVKNPVVLSKNTDVYIRTKWYYIP